MNGLNGLNPSLILSAIIAATPTTVVAVISYITSRRTRSHVQRLEVNINSRVSQLIDSTAAGAGALGELKGAEDERARQGEQAEAE